MANTPRSGADGTGFAIGAQPAYGTALTQNSDMLPLLFPASEISLDEDAEITESDLISAFGADVASEIGQLWGAGSITTGILPEHFIHIIQGILNPDIAASKPLTVPAANQLKASASGLPATVTPGQTAGKAQATHTTASNIYDWPCKVQLALTGAPTIASDAQMVIQGRRRLGRGARDLVAFTERVDIDAATGATSGVFWQNIDNITFSGITGGTSPTWALNWIPDTFYTEAAFRPADQRFPGWTMILIKGGVPYLAVDAVPTGITLNADGTGISVQVNILASRIEELRTVEGGLFEEKVALETADTNYYKTVSLDRMPGWAGAFLFGDDVVKYNSLELGINRNLEFDPGIDGSKFRSGLSPSNNRQVTFTPNTQFISGELATDTFKRWQRAFRFGERQALKFQMRGYNADSRQLQITAETPSGQITESPQTPVTGAGPIERRIPFKALTAAGVTSEVKFGLWTNTQLQS